MNGLIANSYPAQARSTYGGAPRTAVELLNLVTPILMPGLVLNFVRAEKSSIGRWAAPAGTTEAIEQKRSIQVPHPARDAAQS
jgi:hypothetical protein